mmetsp:Transcript_74410/g.241617  ORF Transcript_74410/g.241617 Transcript_74410/m.241617 type:complete len:138 (-) Transcript_74410:44-457(-)
MSSLPASRLHPRLVPMAERSSRNGIGISVVIFLKVRETSVTKAVGYIFEQDSKFTAISLPGANLDLDVYKSFEVPWGDVKIGKARVARVQTGDPVRDFSNDSTHVPRLKDLEMEVMRAHCSSFSQAGWLDGDNVLFI